MLSELYISNFALIDDITIRFDRGLNIFTGSTGVGKSLIIGALNFLLGSRATNDIIRMGENETSVGGVFLVNNEDILKIIKGYVDNLDDGEVVIQRSLDRNGRNRCRINNKPVTVSILKEIGELLVNIHGQHEHESLTNPLQQLIILDGFAGLNEKRIRFSEAYGKAVEKEKLLHSLLDKQSERKRQIDLFHHEINEIESSSLKPDEAETLEEERLVLANSEKIQNVLSYCSDSLYESDNSIIAGLRNIANELSGIKAIDKGLENTIEACNQAIYQLEDVAATLRNSVERYEYDPGRLEEVEDRIETIRRLRHKYGESIADIISYCERSREGLKQLLKAGEDLEVIEKDLAQLKYTIIKAGKELTEQRNKAGRKLSALIKKELSELGIADGRFDINVSTVNMTAAEHIYDAGNTGFDRVEFMFSSNPGEELKLLRKIASGGEISRIMLALKRHLAQADQTPVLVFDEIDANIGGRMGKVIGEKLKRVSQSHQVICITHLPQIASYAEQHLKVNKFAKNNKTFVTIEMLSAKERQEEIAEMIRGTERTDVTRKQAKEMIDDAQGYIRQKTES